MSEPTNPLFEEEKAFLERKKLEYERALRGDVAMLKEQTAHAGRIAAVGAGLAGSIWVITKLFTNKTKKYDDDYDRDDQYDYPTQHFGDYDDDERDQSYAEGRWQDDEDAYFGNGGAATGHGAVYHSDGDRYDNPGANDDDDNGLSDYPDFPEHSGHQHGAPAAGEDNAEQFQSEAYGHPDSTLPFDDSRRLPESEEFVEDEEQPIDQHPGAGHATAPKRTLGTMLVGFAKSDLGKMVVGQAASLAITLATKAIKHKLPSDDAETPKIYDLVAPTGENDGYAHGHPATPPPDAYSAPAAAPLS